MEIKNSTYITFIEIAMELVGAIQPYSSKYSKKMFTQQQLFILLILKQKLKLSYNELIEDMKTRESILLMMGMFKLPHPSTLKKFAKRIQSKLIEKLIGNCINLTKKRKLNLGIDATGYHVEDGSFYYRQRLGNACKTRKNLKLSIAVETDRQIVVMPKIRKSRAHDSIDFIHLADKSNKIKPVRRISADKGYDSNTNCKFVIKTLKAKAFIAYRDYGKKRIFRNNMKYRNMMIRNFDDDEYHQRSKVETVNFVMKRLFGAIIYAKIWMMQKKELLFKCLAYNVYRLVKMRISP